MTRRLAVVAALLALSACTSTAHQAGTYRPTTGTPATVGTSAPARTPAPSQTTAAGCGARASARGPLTFGAAARTVDDSGGYCATIQPKILQDPASIDPGIARILRQYRYVGLQVRITNTWTEPFGVDGSFFDLIGIDGSSTQGDSTYPAQRLGPFIPHSDIRPGQTVTGVVGFALPRHAVLRQLEFHPSGLTDPPWIWQLPARSR